MVFSDFDVVLCLYRTDQEIQTYTIAVINALFLKAPDERRQVSCISSALKPVPRADKLWCRESPPLPILGTPLGFSASWRFVWPDWDHSQIQWELVGDEVFQR